MDNQRGPFESRQGFWPEKAVGVGDHPYDLTFRGPAVDQVGGHDCEGLAARPRKIN